MKRGILLILLFIIIAWGKFYAQDLHFSQFYAAPLTTNPALTGNFDGLVRISTNYRLQWSNIALQGFLYQTPAASVDINLLENKLALGIIAVNDQTNNKTFNTLEFGTSVAYKIKFWRMHVSFGLQGWYSQNYVDLNKVSNSVIQTESNLNNSLKRYDFSAGLFAVYKYPNDKNFLYYGLSLSHLVPNKDNYSISNSSSSIPMRMVIHAGADFTLSYNWKLIPGLFFAYQATASQLNLGNTLGYIIDGDNKSPISTVFFGLWARTNESQIQALIPKVGFEHKRIRTTISYDYIVNGLSSNDSKPHTLELSLNYIINPPKRNKDFSCIYNPYF